MLLHEQIAELIKENNELKLKLEKKNSIENNPPPVEKEPKDRVIRKKERMPILPDSRNTSTSQEKSSFIIKSVQPSPKASLGRTL